MRKALMKNAFASFLAVSMLAGFVSIAAAQSQAAGPAKVVGTGSTALLADPKGMTLYVYDKDAPKKSNCNGPCAANWPPLAATASDKPSGPWSIVTRDDGSLQWAYDGKPVYSWKNDKAPGDTTGDGVGGSWHVARPGAPAAAPQGAPGGPPARPVSPGGSSGN
jgi:predicted lipoprotein with Yx(FWY)xxD motif